MNWGRGIALALAAFVTMIGVMVYKSAQQDFYLVTDHYYEESLDYDRVQNMKSNYSLLENQARVSVDKDSKKLNVQLPEGFEDAEGTVHLYCPTDSKADRRINLEQPFDISTADLKKGKWKVIVDWKKDEKSYLFEQVVFLN